MPLVLENGKTLPRFDLMIETYGELNAEKNNYIFMCADPEKLGYHKFTDSDIEHAKNAKAYHEWLNKNKIK